MTAFFDMWIALPRWMRAIMALSVLGFSAWWLWLGIIWPWGWGLGAVLLLASFPGARKQGRVTGMSTHEKFDAIVIRRGWYFDKVDVSFRDRDGQVIDPANVLSALPKGTTLDELMAYVEERRSMCPIGLRYFPKSSGTKRG